MKKRDKEPDPKDPAEDYEDYEPKPRKGKKVLKPKKTYGAGGDSKKPYGDSWDS